MNNAHHHVVHQGPPIIIADVPCLMADLNKRISDAARGVTQLLLDALQPQTQAAIQAKMISDAIGLEVFCPLRLGFTR